MAEDFFPVEMSLQEYLNEDSPYCDFSSCALPLDHDGDHRCRCGQLVVVPRPSCTYHPIMPEPITVGSLYSILESLTDSHLVEKSPVLIEGKSVVDVKIIGNCVVLRTFEQMLEEDRQ